MMLILASILNYGLLKFLTVKVAPIEVVKGKMGKKGRKGPVGNRGKVGDQGVDADRKILGKNDKLLGDRGIKGEKGKNADKNCPSQSKYCIEDDDDSSMNLTGFRARTLPNICLFGYKPEVINNQTICRSPIRGKIQQKNCPINESKKCITHKIGNYTTDLVDKSHESYFEPDEWVPSNEKGTFMNCSYNKEVIEKMTPPQFKAWVRLLAKRDCPGVPIDGTTVIPPKKDKNNNLIWNEPAECIQQIDESKNLGIGYYNSRASGKNECLKVIRSYPRGTKLPNNKWASYQRCSCTPYKPLELGAKCVDSNECSQGGSQGSWSRPKVLCIKNRCRENCKIYGNSKIQGTSDSDPNDENSEFKCYGVNGSDCDEQNKCQSGKCNKKCVESCSNGNKTPYEFKDEYDAELYPNQPFNYNDYDSNYNGNAYSCFTTPTLAPTPAPSECPMGYPPVDYNRRKQDFEKCEDATIDSTTRRSESQAEETSGEFTVGKNINTPTSDDVYVSSQF